MVVDTLVGTPEFDSTNEREKIEIERKLTLLNPNSIDIPVGEAEPVRIEQVYLSHPREEFSLRLRRQSSRSGITYLATLKDRGRVTPNGLARLETPTVISREAYEYFASMPNTPKLSKTRFEPVPGVSVDFIDGWPDSPIVEIEDPDKNPEARIYYDTFRDILVDHSDDILASNEFIAHKLSGSLEREPRPLDSGDIAEEILASLETKNGKIVVTLSGRSGSGKSTIARDIKDLLELHRPNLTVSILSTDDYHVGKTKIESLLGRPCDNWDEPIVYDTKGLAFDAWQLQRGGTIPRRQFSFSSQETKILGDISPSDVVIVEGIVASSADLDKVRDLHFELGTPLATCIGRDLSRIRNQSRNNSSIGSIEDRLKYQLEVAEPTFVKHNRQIRNVWSASTRRLGSAASSSASLLDH